MADKTESALTVATSMNRTTDYARAVIGGNSRLITPANLQASMRAGALVKKSADQTAANFTTETALTWNAEDYDTSSIHDTVTNSDRLTTPSGANYVRLTAFVRIDNITAGQWANLVIKLNGSTVVGAQTIESDSTTVYISVTTPVLPVTTPGTDYYTVSVQVESDTSVDIKATPSRFGMEIVG